MSKLPLSLLVAGAALLNASAAGAATYGPSFYPNDPFFPYSTQNNLENFAGQWHLVNMAPDNLPWSYADPITGLVIASGTMKNAHLDVNIKGAWNMGVTGKGVIIGIIDDGVEGTHEDLAPNYLKEFSKNFSQNPDIANADQGPVQPDDQHGIAVAGVAAGRGGNGIGITGAAPYASIAGQRISFGTSQSDPAITAQDVADAFLWDGRDAAGTAVNSVTLDGKYLSEARISVKNNSWGMRIGFYESENPNPAEVNRFDKANIQFKALKAASANNVIFVFAAGNERGTIGEQAQTRFLDGAEVSIAVAALGSDGIHSYYSNFGSNVFVTAPSNSDIDTFGITTTDRTDALGYNSYVKPAAGTVETLTDLPDPNYTSGFGGTSSASPLVAGIVALGKQVAPVMDVRLTKHAFVLSSRIVDAEDNSLAVLGGRGWVKNAAGHSFNANYGFGLIDATGFVNTVIDSAYITDRTTYSTGTLTVGEAIVVGKREGVSRSVEVSIPALQNQPLETVEAHVKVTGKNVWQDLNINLTSPSGTVGDVLLYNNYVLDAQAPTDAKLAYIEDVNGLISGFDWYFTMNNFWGENANGTWKIQAFNRGFLSVGENIQFDSYELIFNMGALVFEKGSGLNIASGITVKAHSLNLDHSPFTVDAGGTFTVTDSINVYGGTVRIYGVADEGAPAENPEFFKGSLVTVGTGGTFRIEAGGKLVATRGLNIIGGDFANYGEMELGTGSITVDGGGTFFSVQSPPPLQGSLSVGENGDARASFVINTGAAYDPKGALTVADDLSLGGGLIYVPESITIGGKTSISGGRLQTGAYTSGGDVTLTGGALSADTLAAPSVTVNYGILNITRDITGPDALTSTAVVINGEEDKGKRGWYSPGGIGTLGEDLRGVGNMLFAAKSAGVASPVPGNITTAKVDGRTVVLPAQIQGSLTIGQYGMLLIDAKNFLQPGGVTEILSDTVHVTGAVNYLGALYINNIADKDGKFPHPKVNDTITLITTDTGSNKLDGGEIDTTYATMAPTLRYDVRTRDWVNADDVLVQNGEVYAIAIRDYAPVAARFTTNQQAVANMFANLWYDYQRAKGLLSGTSLIPPNTGYTTSGPVPFPPITRPVNDGIAATDDGAPDGYAYEDLFASIDSVTTFDQLRALYTQLAPANSIILEQTFRQQARSQTAAVRNRAREARSSFIQPGSLWTSSLFGESYGFNYTQPYDGPNEDNPVTVWLNGGGSYTPGRGNKNGGGYDTKSWNGAVGADYRFSNAFLLGLQVSYNGSQTSFKDTGMKNTSDSVLGAIYAAGNAGKFYYNALAGVSSDSHSFRRNLDFGRDSELTGGHKGTPGGSSALVAVEIGYEWNTRDAKDSFGISTQERGGYWSYGPTLALQYYRSSVDSYTESGGNDFNGWQRLSVGKQTYESFNAQIGIQISRVINFEAVSILPEFRLSWIHEFKTEEADITARLTRVPGADSFRIHGNKPTSDYANIGLGLSARLSPNVNATLNYDCYAFLKDTNPSHQFTATVRVSF